MSHKSIRIDEPDWAEFAAHYVEECFATPEQPIRAVLERLVDSRDERTWKVLRRLMCAAWGDLADFAAKGQDAAKGRSGESGIA